MLFLFYYALVNPIVEERWWRGAVLGPGFRSRIGARGARVLSSVGFLPHHAVVLVASYGFILGAALVFPVLAAACLWTAWRERTGRVWLPLASHAGTDVGLALLYIVLLRT
jgi:membrane protease YdiL (CAAX protease family)